MSRLHALAGGLYADLKFAARLRRRAPQLRALQRLAAAGRQGRPRVVFNLVNPALLRDLQLETALAASVAEAGGRPLMLVDDGVLRHHEDVQCEGRPQPGRCLRKQLARRLTRGVPLYGAYSDFVTPAEQAQVAAHAEALIAAGTFTYAGVDLWPAVESSLVRYYRSTAGWLTREADYAAQLRTCTENALLGCLVAERVHRVCDPDVVVTSHGIYTSWGPFYEYFKQQGTPVLVFAKGSHAAGSLKYVHRSEGAYFEQIKDTLDAETARAHAERIMGRRFEGRASDLERFGLHAGEAEVAALLDGDPRDVFGLFTNLLWDRSLAGADGLFGTYTDWLAATVAAFRARPERLLLIRAHPAEALPGKRPRVGAREIVAEVLGEALPADRAAAIGNVVFVPARVKLRSYALFPYLAAGLVYNGTIGLEMMYHGLPVLVSGAAFYHDAAFVKHYASQADYFAQLDRLPALLAHQEAHRTDLHKFIYYYFEQRYMPLPEAHFGTRVPAGAPPQAVRAILEGDTLRRLTADILAAGLPSASLAPASLAPASPAGDGAA